MGYAFISYSTKNQACADAMRELFRKNGIDTWMAPYNIPAGSKYAAVITKAIRECSCFVLLLSRDSQDSEAVDSEVELAALTFKKSIITVELEKVVLNDAFTFYIHNKQIIAVHEMNETSPEVRQVLQAVKAYTGEPPLAQAPAVNANTRKAAAAQAPAVNANTRKAAAAQAPAMSAFPKKLPAKRILKDRYELVKITKESGDSVTYKGYDLEEQRNVLVQVIQTGDPWGVIRAPEYMASRDFRRYPGIWEVYDAFVTPDKKACIVMEWIDNAIPMTEAKDLWGWADNDASNFINKLKVLTKLSNAVNSMYRLGLVHANIQPSNIVFVKNKDGGYDVKLTNFTHAFSTILQKKSARRDYTDSGKHYSAPEKKWEHRSDVYSLGMVAFWWLTGKLPEITATGQLNYTSVSGLDKSLMKILRKATAFLPLARYESPFSLGLELNSYLHSLQGSGALAMLDSLENGSDFNVSYLFETED